MAIWVSSLARVRNIAELRKPERILSLLDPDDDFPEFDGYSADTHHTIGVEDVSNAEDAIQLPPGLEHARQVINFVESWSKSAPILIHCWAGVSRSTASAFIAACIANPKTDEYDIAETLRDASPTANPNIRLVEFADELLGRRGRMVAAIESMGRGEPTWEAQPFYIPSSFDPVRGHI
ncbi:MAG: protein-tyrosine phosphatase family protein [Pseudomonadota bacterium]